MNKKAFIMIILISILMSNTGCWGKVELSDLGLVTATGVDLEPNGDIRITVVSITPLGFGTKGEPEKSNAWIGTAVGETFADAKRNLNETATKQLAWFHNRFIIIGENLAKQGIGDIMNHLARNRDFRYENKILITPVTAYDMLTIPADIEKNLVLEIDGIVDNIKEEWAKSYVENFKDIIVDLCEEKSGFVTGRVYYYEKDDTTISTNRGEVNTMESEGKEQYVAIIKGSSVFKDDKMVGWIDGIETQAYMLITDEVKSGVLTTSYNDGKDSLSFTFRRSDSRVKAEFSENQISFNIDLEVIGEISTLYTGQNIRKEEEINKMEQAISNAIKNNLKNTVSKAQKELKTDFLGFGEHIFRRHPKQWREIGDRWDKIFPKISVNYDIQVRIDRSGIISNSVR
ncbi:Ger(x)C family spore germination protein [Herbivorax sp. ANBcel31]|uniref:Ger(x)C family spore germination protein n=1 Tax=Herbivorax sp. ANBcel31 TaxID=3069754 RepID=UPI0027B877BC|nr:Ger(x)C family spore germination protein [Herbivorax sp. ANBcel31]MDQ2085576.1 Ger(x)C family spore germination protein [Herbivorax sp. ANBcel31]